MAMYRMGMISNCLNGVGLSYSLDSFHDFEVYQRNSQRSRVHFYKTFKDAYHYDMSYDLNMKMMDLKIHFSMIYSMI